MRVSASRTRFVVVHTVGRGLESGDLLKGVRYIPPPLPFRRAQNSATVTARPRGRETQRSAYACHLPRSNLDSQAQAALQISLPYSSFLLVCATMFPAPCLWSLGSVYRGVDAKRVPWYPTRASSYAISQRGRSASRQGITHDPATAEPPNGTLTTRIQEVSRALH